VVLSNVLKVDSLEDHKRMGTEVHQLIQARHPLGEDATGAAAEEKPDAEAVEGAEPHVEPAADAKTPKAEASPAGGYTIESSPGAVSPSPVSPPPDDGASSSQR
jgi:hypothetical protein